MKNTCLKFKILIVLFGMLILCILQSKNVNAASASISASSKSVSVGDKVSINVSVNAMAWNVKVSGSGVSGSIVGGNMENMSNKSTSKSYTLDTSKAGSYTVSISGDVTDANGTNSGVSDSVTVKVSEKSTTNTDKNNNTNKTNTNTTTKNDTTTSEPTFKTAKDTVYATGNINIRKSYNTDSEIIGKLEIGDSISRTGIGDNGWSKVSYNGSTGYIKTSLLSDKEPEKSSDKALKTLVVTPEGLEPEFSPEVTTYTLNVDKDTEKIDIKAAPNDSNAKVEITGNENLKDGDNIVKIVVTAQDETARTYTINVKKQGNNSLGLTSLTINGYSLSPKFSSNVYEYKLNILDPKVTKLDITANANDENATVQISGNTDLKEGDNIVEIVVTSQDQSDKTIYKITVNKTPMTAGTTKNTNGNAVYIGIIVAILAIFAISVFVIKKNKNRKAKAVEQDDELDDLYGYSSNKNRTGFRENNNLESSNDVVDHELFGELPGENYVNDNKNVYAKVSNDYNNIKSNEDENSYNNVYKSFNSYDTNKANETFETNNSNMYSNNVTSNSSYGGYSDIKNEINDEKIYEKDPYKNLYSDNNDQQTAYKNVAMNVDYNNNNTDDNKSIYGNTMYGNFGQDSVYNQTNSINQDNANIKNSIYESSQYKGYNNDNIINNQQSAYTNVATNNNINTNSSAYDSSKYSSLYTDNNVQQEVNKSKENSEQSTYSNSTYNDIYGTYNTEKTPTFETDENQNKIENPYANTSNSTSSIEDDYDDEEYTLDDNYKMKRTRGKHSK